MRLLKPIILSSHLNAVHHTTCFKTLSQNPEDLLASMQGLINFLSNKLGLEEMQLKQSMCQLFTSSIYSELSVLEEPHFCHVKYFCMCTGCRYKDFSWQHKDCMSALIFKPGLLVVINHVLFCRLTILNPVSKSTSYVDTEKKVGMKR